MKTVIAQSFLNAITYSEYRNIISELILQEKSTGDEQSDDLLHYSKLNETRMNRLDKTIHVGIETSQELNALMHEYYWLVLAEGWCGDAAQLVPIFNKMASVSNNVELKLLFRDENLPLMNMFLTNGSKSIPKLIVLEKETLEVKGTWGPRPEGALKLIRSYKQQYGVIDETAKAELQLWYLHDKGLSTQNELTTLMHHLEQLERNVRK